MRATALTRLIEAGIERDRALELAGFDNSGRWAEGEK